MRVVCAAILLVILTVSASASQSCPSGLKPYLRSELFFGRSAPNGHEVSESEWQGFLKEAISPRFPNGFTVEDGVGQWKSGGAVIGERSKHVLIVHPPGQSGDIEAIRALYKARFHQQSVLRFDTEGCASF